MIKQAREFRFITRKHGPRTQLMALFSYMNVLCLVPMLFNRGDEYVMFHARQGVVLWIWAVVAMLGLHIPVIGGFLFSLSAVLIAMLSLVGLVSVALGRAWRIPVVARFAGHL
ncbi:MAG: hypothetical protein H7831_09775 [Magnetococcus sp. WYHC-3]